MKLTALEAQEICVTSAPLAAASASYQLLITLTNARGTSFTVTVAIDVINVPTVTVAASGANCYTVSTNKLIGIDTITLSHSSLVFDTPVLNFKGVDSQKICVISAPFLSASYQLVVTLADNQKPPVKVTATKTISVENPLVISQSAESNCFKLAYRTSPTESQTITMSSKLVIFTPSVVSFGSSDADEKIVCLTTIGTPSVGTFTDAVYSIASGSRVSPFTTTGASFSLKSVMVTIKQAGQTSKITRSSRCFDISLAQKPAFPQLVVPPAGPAFTPATLTFTPENFDVVQQFCFSGLFAASAVTASSITTRTTDNKLNRSASYSVEISPQTSVIVANVAGGKNCYSINLNYAERQKVTITHATLKFDPPWIAFTADNALIGRTFCVVQSPTVDANSNTFEISFSISNEIDVPYVVKTKIALRIDSTAIVTTLPNNCLSVALNQETIADYETVKFISTGLTFSGNATFQKGTAGRVSRTVCYIDSNPSAISTASFTYKIEISGSSRSIPFVSSSVSIQTTEVDLVVSDTEITPENLCFTVAPAV